MSAELSRDYRGALDWLRSRPDFEVLPAGDQTRAHFPLARPARLLEHLGRPDQAYRIILVAGTKGKGSTAALLASILAAHGQRVGLYSQPHLHTLRERLRVGDQLITPDELTQQLETIRPEVEQLDAAHPELGPLTAYEIMTVLGLAWFRGRGIDWAVLEVGLGGRLDATNVVAPEVAVITPISYDHTHILGRRLGQIAGEKAGIIKPGARVVSARQRPAAIRAIRAAALAQGARLSVVGQTSELPVLTEHRVLRFRADSAPPRQPFFHVSAESARRAYGTLDVYLAGLHQLENLETALATLECAEESGLQLDSDAVRRGVAATRWPGRFDLAGAAPLVVIDGAHNGESARRLREAVDLHVEYDRLHLVLGAFADKDVRAIARPFADAAVLTAVQPPGSRARPAEQTAHIARRMGIRANAVRELSRGLGQAISAAGPNDVVCVTGSLAIVAQAREALGICRDGC